MKHVHHDVLIALAEGKEIQFKSRHVNDWTTTKSSGVNPIKDTDLEWRAKPDFIEECFYHWQTSNTTCNDKLGAYTAGFIRGAMAHEQGEYW